MSSQIGISTTATSQGGSHSGYSLVNLPTIEPPAVHQIATLPPPNTEVASSQLTCSTTKASSIFGDRASEYNPQKDKENDCNSRTYSCVARVARTCFSALSGAVVGGVTAKTWEKARTWYEGQETQVGERTLSIAAGKRLPDGAESPVERYPDA